MQQKNNKKVFMKIIYVVLFFCILLFCGFIFIIRTPSHQAKKAVEEFYSFEQTGNFSDSWEMFHPLMKQRFAKGYYLQDRVHVFFNHFGVSTFTFMLDDVELIRNWQLEKDAEPIDKVYKVTVSQYFEGKYGNFVIVQDVFATPFDGEWVILWDYKKSS